MEMGVLIGIVLAAFCMYLGIFLAGSSVLLFIDIGSVFVTIGGSIASMMITFPLRTILQIPSLIKVAITPKEQPVGEIITLLVKFAERARREGILALEKQLEEVHDSFLRNGIQLAVDGTEPELLKDIMETELSYVEERHNAGKFVFDFMASMGPAWGMIGTLVGLVIMLANLSDPSALGPGMAIAIITTFYGSVLANVVALPLAGKLSAKHKDEILVRKMMIMGILSIQSGDNPRIVEQKLNSFISPGLRKLKEEK